jgi:hypothetical protein
VRSEGRAARTATEGLHQQLLELLLLGPADLEREAFAHRTGRPTRAVDVDVGRPRQLVVDDVVDGGDVESTGGNVGRKQDRVRRALEPVEVLEPLLLLQVRMEGEDGQLEELEQRDRPPDAVDRAKEDDRPARVAQKKVVEVEVLLSREAVDLRLLQGRDDAALGREVDDLGVLIPEVELLEEII